MKLIIQIPCYNEEDALPIALSKLPREVPGCDQVEWLIIDDGSTDRTVEVAKANGVDHIVKLPKHQGLARGFMAGLTHALKLGADVIVNTDADDQYNAADIPLLVAPIINGEAEITIGARPIDSIEHFSLLKRLLQKFGSWVVRQASNTSIPDAPSGFRAFSREAALHMNVFNFYTYTLETIIQAGIKDMSIRSVPIRVNEKLRPSRLVKSIPAYVSRSLFTIVRIFVVYQPFKSFFRLGLLLFSCGFLIGLRFLYHYITAGGAGHIQSLILAGALLILGFQTILVAFLADLLAVNRSLLEDMQYRTRSKDCISERQSIQKNSSKM